MQIPEYKEKLIKFKLIYDAIKDGQNVENFHSKCNNCPNTLTLIETNNIRIFGLFKSIDEINIGPFTKNPWHSDNRAFFISLDKEKIYKII